MGELKFFLGLQTQQSNDKIFVCQTMWYKIDITKYRGMIKYLLYLIVSRPNIMLSV